MAILKKNKLLQYLAVFCFLFFIESSNAGEIEAELLNEISNQRLGGNINVIIEFNKTDILTTNRFDLITSLQNNAASLQKPISDFLRSNGIESTSIWINNSLAASVPSQLLQLIADNPYVSFVKKDRKITLDAGNPGTLPSQSNWNLTSIEADKVWNNGVTGSGIVIGTMDTGIDIDHPDLATRYRGGGNSWYDPYGVYSAPHDPNGHGTQVLGLIVGGDSSGENIGVAPGAQWISAKIFDNTNTATISKIHLAFQWMLDPDGNPATNDAPNIVNNSWNFDVSNTCDTEFENDITILDQAGIAVVFSSGNSGPNTSSSHSPANNNGTLPVGSNDEQMNIAFSSSRGPSACNSLDIYPKVAAPGVNVKTADLTLGGTLPNSYTFSSGTSFAAAHVTGALALLQSKYPGSTLADRKIALFNTATPAGTINDSGYGIINVNAAIQYIDPVVQLISPSGNIGAVNNPTFTWNSVKGSTWYKLYVNDSTGNVINQWYTASLANCDNGELSCSVTPTLTLADGAGDWQVRAYNTLGNGPWSDPGNFFIGNAPLASTLISPTGIVASTTPTYTWNAVSNTTWYYLWVDDSTGNVIKQWYTADSAGCANGETICSVTPATSLAPGSVQWWIKTNNPVGDGPWSPPLNFTVGGLPGAADLVSPTGSIVTNNPTYTWNSVPNASWYYLWVNDATGNVIKQWYTADLAGCANGEPSCSVTPATNVSSGNGKWWVRTYNDVGLGPWSINKAFSAP